MASNQVEYHFKVEETLAGRDSVRPPSTCERVGAVPIPSGKQWKEVEERCVVRGEAITADNQCMSVESTSDADLQYPSWHDSDVCSIPTNPKGSG